MIIAGKNYKKIATCVLWSRVSSRLRRIQTSDFLADVKDRQMGRQQRIKLLKFAVRWCWRRHLAASGALACSFEKRVGANLVSSPAEERAKQRDFLADRPRAKWCENNSKRSTTLVQFSRESGHWDNREPPQSWVSQLASQRDSVRTQTLAADGRFEATAASDTCREESCGPADTRADTFGRFAPVDSTFSAGWSTGTLWSDGSDTDAADRRGPNHSWTTDGGRPRMRFVFVYFWFALPANMFCQGLNFYHLQSSSQYVYWFIMTALS